MALWRAIVTVLFLLLVLSQFASVESKRKRPKGRKAEPTQQTLQQLCHGSGSHSSKKSVLELQAFVDLGKAFACLKVETCSRVPVCFVEDTPDLRQESLNDCTVWTLLLQGLQTNRRIEPVMESHLNRRNNRKSRTDNSWDEAVSSLCQGANVYRFMPGDTAEERNTSSSGTSKNSSSTDIRTSEKASSLGRPRKRRQGGAFNAFIRRQMRRKQNANNNSTCGVLEGCTRICVGQNEKFTNVSDCAQFKIHCTSRKFFRTRTRKGRGKDRRRNSRQDK